MPLLPDPQTRRRGLSALLLSAALLAGLMLMQTAAHAATPDDPYWPEQWWLQPVGPGNPAAAGFDPLQAAQPGNPLPVIAVLDSGITAHPDFDTRRLLPGYDFVADASYANDGDGRDADPSDPGDALSQFRINASPDRFSGCDSQDSSWHGTSVMGVLAATSNNAMGVASATPLARVMPLRVSGLCGASTQDVIDAMRWAAGIPGVCRTFLNPYDPAQGCATLMPPNPTPARIINFSLGHAQACDASYSRVIAELRQRGVLVVAAAGNEAGAVERPGNCPGVLTVAALNRLGMKAWYSSFGPQVALSTPGGDVNGQPWDDSGVLTLSNTGTTRPRLAAYTTVQGTSFTAPMAAAAAAQMLQADPALTPDEIIQGLKASARPHTVVDGWPSCSASAAGSCNCTPSTCGAGQLDAQEALRWAVLHAAGQPYTPPVRNAVHLSALDVGGIPPSTAPTPALLGSSDGGVSSGGGGGATGPVALLIGALAALGLRVMRRRG
ncbi:S8 family serine peptidase [Amphibiibacter pelophylacis]|uniref:S8 family serine peptidase n=1 Tax=Amphibiibacter pelophylacis TaxID=1799477 RepID=A0ACC6NZW2_9BURK